MQALLIDDSRSALDFLRHLVEADGTVKATPFTDPETALDNARTREFDIVLVDYEMPKMDGISLIRKLRALPSYADVPIVMVTSIETEDVRLKALEAGATDFLPKRPRAIELQIRIRNLIKLGVSVRKLNNRAEDLVNEVASATAKLREREEEIVLRLARAVEYRDNDTGHHTLRVARYSRLIAEQLQLSECSCREIYLAAPLHDVGKVAVSDRVLLKPGRLDDEEMAHVRTHTLIGDRILADSPCDLIRLAAVIARSHHERWDGTGYPDGLAGDTIPLAARIVAVADVFDALTTRRPYKEPMPAVEARRYLEDRCGREFDPHCVDAFLSRWDDVLEICEQLRTAPSDALNDTTLHDGRGEITPPSVVRVASPAFIGAM